MIKHGAWEATAVLSAWLREALEKVGDWSSSRPLLGSAGAKHTGVQLLHSRCDCGPAPSRLLGLVVHLKMGTIVASDADKAISTVPGMWGYAGNVSLQACCTVRA